MATYPEVGTSARAGTASTGSATPSTTPSSAPRATGGPTSGTSDRSVTDEARATASQAVDTVKDEAQSRLETQKDRAAEQLGGIESALRDTSRSLRDNEQQPIAEYVDRAAQQVSQLNDYLRNHTVGDLLNEAERFARREPALFLGGAALLGLAAARFFRASSPSAANGSYASRSGSRTGGYTTVHNTPGAMMPRVDAPRSSPQREFVASSGSISTEGRTHG